MEWKIMEYDGSKWKGMEEILSSFFDAPSCASAVQLWVEASRFL
jgi:hypothetical protein